MRIGIDILGGDYAPLATVKGSIQAYDRLKDKATIVLFGDEAQIRSICNDEQFVITSYSIHYTKLYELAQSKRRSQKPHLILQPGATGR